MYYPKELKTRRYYFCATVFSPGTLKPAKNLHGQSSTRRKGSYVCVLNGINEKWTAGPHFLIDFAFFKTESYALHFNTLQEPKRICNGSTTTQDRRNFAMDIYGSDWYGKLASGAAIEFYVLKVKQIVRLQHGPS